MNNKSSCNKNVFTTAKLTTKLATIRIKITNWTWEYLRIQTRSLQFQETTGQLCGSMLSVYSEHTEKVKEKETAT